MHRAVSSELAAENGGILANWERQLSISRRTSTVVALICLCFANPIFPLLTFLQRFVDSKLRTLEIFDSQHQDLGGPLAAYRKNLQDQMFAW